MLIAYVAITQCGSGAIAVRLAGTSTCLLPSCCPAVSCVGPALALAAAILVLPIVEVGESSPHGSSDWYACFLLLLLTQPRCPAFGTIGIRLLCYLAVSCTLNCTVQYMT